MTTVPAYVPIPLALPDCAPIAGQKSHANLFEPHRFRAKFPDQWSGFLRAHFRNAEEVAVTFDVTYQTARNWLDGSHRPSGDKVALAAVSMPARFAAAFGKDAA